MVKRQTVWLSTMMVLSLMLIGYYTMNNESSLTTSSQTNSTSIATTSGQPGNSSSTGQATGNQAGTTGNSAQSQSTGSSTGTPTTTTDWFVNMQTQLDTQMTQQIDTETQIISNNNASATQLSQAEDKLRQLQTLQGELANAKEMILAQGYKDCVIVPSSDGGKVIVYVKASKISNSSAVALMNIVSQELNMSASNVVVQIKA